MLSGLAAFVYVAVLWCIAPAFLREGASVAERLRVTIGLGIGVPAVLGLLHLLYAPALWAALAALVVWRVRKGAPVLAAPELGLYAAFAGVVVVMWPPLARPLLDGDTMLYHLPNAVDFVQSHSVWVAHAPYWVYPPASELFASGLFAASGRWSLPLAGILPALLLTARLYVVARENGASAFASASVPLAFMCMPVAAFQSGTLQNDLWLAAFFVEVLAADRSALPLAVCALLKPYGWLEGLIAAAAMRVTWRTVAIAAVAPAVWALRDAVLIVQGASLGFSSPGYFATTIAGNIGAGVPQLAHGVATVSPQAFVWIAALAFGFVFPATRRFAAAAAAALLLYAFLPVSYSNGITNYVLDASSLRYALPALAAGALAAAVIVNRAGNWGVMAAYAVAVWGAWNVLGVYWNDSYTHWALPVAAVLLCASLLPGRIRPFSAAAAALAILLAGAWSSSSRAQGFYGDWMRQPSGKPTGVFAWIARHAPQRIVASNVRIGAILMSSPTTLAQSAQPGDQCEQARNDRALLFVGSNEGLTQAEFKRAETLARSCGSMVYEDGASLVVQVP